jgi:hypothetical protein
MKRAIAAVMVASLAAAGCSRSGSSGRDAPPDRGAPTPGQQLVPVVASSEIVVGENRLQIGLIDRNDAPVREPDVSLEVGFLGPGDEAASARTTMSFVWTIKPLQGLWVGNVRIDEPGEWEAVIDVAGAGYDTSMRTAFEVREEGTTPAIETKPPAVDTPTAADVDDLSEITTDSDPDPRFYELSIADALQASRPAVIVFATPKFCSSNVCGPTLSLVKEVARGFPRVDFVHVEPYDLDKVPNELEPVPAAVEWGLPTEPWVFVTDRDGRVAAKYEASVAPRELRAVLGEL